MSGKINSMYGRRNLHRTYQRAPTVKTAQVKNNSIRTHYGCGVAEDKEAWLAWASEQGHGDGQGNNALIINYYMNISGDIPPLLTNEIAEFVLTEVLHDILHEGMLKDVKYNNVRRRYKMSEHQYKKYGISIDNGHYLLIESGVSLPLAAIPFKLFGEYSRMYSSTHILLTPLDIVGKLLTKSTKVE